jgi:hypothetical protein
VLRTAIEHAVTTGTRYALLFVTVMIASAAIVSRLIPRVQSHRAPTLSTESVDGLESMAVSPLSSQ